MPFLNRLARAVALTLLLASTAAPAFAGPADTALLQSFVGNWKGGGKLTGADTGKVTCRMAFKFSKANRLTYTGRCTLGGMGGQSFNGVVTYNEAKKRFESATSAGTVVGQKSSGGVTFTMNETDKRGAISSQLFMGTGRLQFDFSMTDAKTHEVTSATIPLAKS